MIRLCVFCALNQKINVCFSIMRSHVVKYLCLIFLTLCFVGGGFHAAFAQYGFEAPGTGSSNTGAVGIVPVKEEVDGGSIPIGATAQVVVLFRNEGAQPVQTGQINLYPSSNVSAQVSLNQCGQEVLASGGECAIAISVKGLQAGQWRVEMLMTHTGRSRLVTATLSGSIDSTGDSSDKLSSDIEAIPDEIDFGSLAAGQTLVEPVILRNITSNPIDITEIGIKSSDSSGFLLESDCKQLQAGQACIATVRWSPTQKGPSTGVLVVEHNGPTGLASVSLSGDYAPDEVDEAEIFPDAVPGKGLLVSSQTEVDFGDDVDSASTITVSLVNTGDTQLTLNDIKVSGSDNGLGIVGQGCSPGLVLDPIEACPLTINWSPTRIGTILDDVQVLHSGARGILVLPVRGESAGVVSQNQKAIVLTEPMLPTHVIGNEDVTASDGRGALSSGKAPRVSGQQVANAASALDGLKITSFSAKRAIVNGPGGSRLLFNNEPVMLGGVMWDVTIQKNGIEFSANSDRVLLLFDRSLSSINRNSSQSTNTGSSSEETGSEESN